MVEGQEKPRFFVIDAETGEVNTTINDGDRILRKQSLEYVDDRIMNFNKGETFIKIYDAGMRKIRKVLSNAQFSFICHMLPQVEYESNLLRNDDGSLMQIKDMEAITGMCYESNRKLLISLVTLGIVARTHTGSKDKKGVSFECYIVNPYVFHKGVHLASGIIELFSKTGWKEED